MAYAIGILAIAAHLIIVVSFVLLKAADLRDWWHGRT